jgi:type I restriction enzyme S subunit
MVKPGYKQTEIGIIPEDWTVANFGSKVKIFRGGSPRPIQIQNNDILITKDGSLGKAALVQGLSKPATLNSGIFVIRPLQNAYDPVFVYHILSSLVFKDFLDKLSAGSTIIHLYQKDVGKFEFLLPPTIEEQKDIAAVLSETDADIAALEEKLAKYCQVKQGMMQQLLTGKIRLV